MSQLRYLLSKADADALWAEKDKARRNNVLAEDPLAMHKTRFLQWLEVKAAADLEEAIDQGQDETEALVEVTARLRTVTAAWKAEAKRLKGLR